MQGMTVFVRIGALYRFFISGYNLNFSHVAIQGLFLLSFHKAVVSRGISMPLFFEAIVVKRKIVEGE